MRSNNIFDYFNWTDFLKPRQLHKIIKFCKERITKGYCTYDLMDLDNYYTKLLSDSLQDFADKTDGYPQGSVSLEAWKQQVEVASKGLKVYLMSDKEIVERFFSFRRDRTPELDSASKNRAKLLQEVNDVRTMRVKSAMNWVAENITKLWY